MKYAIVSLPDDNYTETNETWILIDKKEAKILIDAVEEYSATHKKSKLAKRMLTEFNNVPCL
jgi:catalase